MASKLNLVRNSRVFFVKGAALENITVDGYAVANSVSDDLTTFADTTVLEIQVLEGLTFSQNTTSETVTLNEAGATPSRGQRTFNTALDPVEFSFSTYVRPKKGATNVDAEEGVLWNAFAKGAAASSEAWTPGASFANLTFANSNYHQLAPFSMIMSVDNVLYAIDNCVLDQATIDFGLDAIATIAWTGRGARLRALDGVTLSNVGSPAVPTFTDGIATGTAKAKDTSAPYLANKLSTVKMYKGINSTDAGAEYSVPLTGGSITLSNNVTYLTPANLATVNKPITYFTGTRAISGSMNAYLRTGQVNSSGVAGDTGELLKDLLASSASEISPTYSITLSIGGLSNATTRIDIALPAAVLTIPTVNAEQVVSTTINFTGHGFTGGDLDITGTNETTIKYYSAA